MVSIDIYLICIVLKLHMSFLKNVFKVICYWIIFFGLLVISLCISLSSGHSRSELTFSKTSLLSSHGELWGKYFGDKKISKIRNFLVKTKMWFWINWLTLHYTDEFKQEIQSNLQYVWGSRFNETHDPGISTVLYQMFFRKPFLSAVVVSNPMTAIFVFNGLVSNGVYTTLFNVSSCFLFSI